MSEEEKSGIKWSAIVTIVLNAIIQVISQIFNS